VLTAKAWMGNDLACFFTDAEKGSDRYVLFFRSSTVYRPMMDGDDMRSANIGAMYELDVFVPAHHLPIIDRAICVRKFP
jgi:hypothetical protein